MKIKIDGIPAQLKTYETANGWRCEVIWMLTWARGGSVLGRGDCDESALNDFHRRAADDGHKIESRDLP
jgi:hypothetical protein